MHGNLLQLYEAVISQVSTWRIGIFSPNIPQGPGNLSMECPLKWSKILPGMVRRLIKTSLMLYVKTWWVLWCFLGIFQDNMHRQFLNLRILRVKSKLPTLQSLGYIISFIVCSFQWGGSSISRNSQCCCPFYKMDNFTVGS